MVLVPLPVTVDGLNPAVTPVGKPVTPNPTDPANPFTAATVAVYGAFCPATTVWVAGEAPSVKSGALVTVSDTLAVWLSAPLVPVITSGYVPGVVFAATVKVMVLVPLPVTVDGLNPAVTPVGKPVTPNPTDPANPFTAATVAVYGAFCPATTLWVAGDAPSVKSGVGGADPDRVAACSVTFPVPDSNCVNVTVRVWPADAALKFSV